MILPKLCCSIHLRTFFLSLKHCLSIVKSLSDEVKNEKLPKQFLQNFTLQLDVQVAYNDGESESGVTLPDDTVALHDDEEVRPIDMPCMAFLKHV